MWIACQFRRLSDRDLEAMLKLIEIGAEIDRPEVMEEERTATAIRSHFTPILTAPQWMLKLTWVAGSIGG